MEGSNSLTAEVPQASRRHKKPPITRKGDFFMVDDNQTIDINPIIIFHQNI
jgi:hypothetical protein